MRVTILSVILLVSVVSHAQKIAVPPNFSSDSALLSNEMPVIARESGSLLRYESTAVYFNNLFHCRLAAGDYAAAMAALDSIKYSDRDAKRESVPARNIQYRSYTLAKLSQAKSDGPFDRLFTEALKKLYEELPEASKPYVYVYFNVLPATLKEKLDRLITEARNKDSLSVSEATGLISAYNSWNVFNQALRPGLQYLQQEESRKFNIQDSVLITMKDGGQLTAVIVRNRAITTPQPAILVYNIYAEDPSDKRIAERAAINGYVGIVVNTRGKNLSPDAIEPFEHDGRDAYEVIDWISRQPWCNGKVGMYGGSYLGFSQWSAVKKIHPALRTIVPQVAVGIGIDYPMHNNVFMTYMLRWIHLVCNNKLTDEDDFGSPRWDSVYGDWYRSGRSFRALDTIEGRPSKIYQRWLDHPSYDSYWQNMVPYGKEFAAINIPILTTTGYFDADQRGAFYYFNQHHKWKPNAEHYLLIGPYDHGGAQNAASLSVAGYHIDSVANINVTAIVFKWFDHILRDSALPAILKDKINYEVMGANSWRSAPSIEAISRDTLTLYFDNTLSRKGYKLVTKQPAEPGFIAQEVNYADRDEEYITEDGLLSSSLPANGKLIFYSEPLKKDIIMTGSFQGKIIASLNKKDIDLAIDLYELKPDGEYFALTEFVGRASYARDRSHRQLLRPGIYESIPVRNTFFVSRQLQKGSRIVVVMGINNNKYWQVNYGTGKDVSEETIRDGAVPLEIKWSNKSYIKLPVEGN